MRLFCHKKLFIRALKNTFLKVKKIIFFELFAKKFAKTGKNRLFGNKKTLKSTLYKAFLRVLSFKLAGVVGLEPTSTVLETAILAFGRYP